MSSHLLEKSVLNVNERHTLLDAFFSVCRWGTIYYSWRPNLRDKADNHLVELAVAGGAEVIVTKNIKDFKEYELQFPQLNIVDPLIILNDV